MKKSDIRLIAVLSSMIVLLFVVIGLAVSVYNAPNTGGNNIEYVPALTTSQSWQTAQTTANSVLVNGYQNDTNTTSNQINNDSGNHNISSSVQTEKQTDSTVNVSSMSNSELLDTLTVAVNKTKAYKGSFSVNHTESFTADVTECTGGSLVKSVANTIIGMVVKPVDEVLYFNNGSATDSEGETSYILLPQSGNFSLSLNGVSLITGLMNGNNSVIKVTLIPETVGLYDVPPVNASALGYLNVNNFDTSLLEITSATINYKGSTIEVHIKPDGYVSYAKFTLPMNAEGSAKAAGISGSAVFDGVQTEIWQFNW